MAFSFMKMTSKWGESIAAPTKVHPELKDVKQGEELLVVAIIRISNTYMINL